MFNVSIVRRDRHIVLRAEPASRFDQAARRLGGTSVEGGWRFPWHREPRVRDMVREIAGGSLAGTPVPARSRSGTQIAPREAAPPLWHGSGGM